MTDDLRARRQLRCSRAGHTLDRGVCTSCGLTVHPARPAPEESQALLGGHRMTVPDPLSPDCEVHKHDACSGDAWDLLRDEITACTCHCHTTRRTP